MIKTNKTILKDALSLPPLEKIELIEMLYDSLDTQQSQKEIDKLWAKEAEQRVEALEKGEIETIPAEVVFKEIEKKLR